MKAKLFFPVICIALGLLVAGCTPTISDLTPNRVPQNPSGIYTLSMTPRSFDGTVVDGTYEAFIVIRGQEHKMRPSPMGEGIFDYDFSMPEGLNEAYYYYILRYYKNQRGNAKPREIKSKKFRFRLANRYVVSLESERAPVGNQIAVMGRGFSKFDTLSVGGVAAETKFLSPNTIAFVVPSLTANQSYPVTIDNGKGITHVGMFRVDPAKLNVHIDSSNLYSSQRTNMVIGIAFDAPAGGLPLDISTDIPASIIMPEVAIPAGARSISVQIEGGEPNSGHLFVTAQGFNEVKLPIVVN